MRDMNHYILVGPDARRFRLPDDYDMERLQNLLSQGLPVVLPAVTEDSMKLTLGVNPAMAPWWSLESYPAD